MSILNTKHQQLLYFHACQAVQADGVILFGRLNNQHPYKKTFSLLNEDYGVYVAKPDASAFYDSIFAEEASRNKASNQPSTSSKEQQEKMLFETIESFAPHSIVVDQSFKVSAIFGNSKQFLEFPSGTFETNLGKLLLPEIRDAVISTIYQCDQSNEACVTFYPLKEGQTALKVSVRFAKWADAKIFVIELTQKAHDNQSANDYDDVIKELEYTRSQFNMFIAEHKKALSQLQILNHELQASNEELQSVNEELVVSNEELMTNVQELTRANQKLDSKSEESKKLDTFLKASHDGIKNSVLILNTKGELTRFNKSAAQLLGIKDSHRNRALEALILQVDVGKIAESARDCLRKNMSASIELSIDKHYFEVYLEPITGIGDEYDGVVITIINNTKLVTALESAQSVESKLISILANIPASVSVKDIDGCYTYVNDLFCTRVGLTKESIINKSDEELFGILEGRRIRNIDYETLKSGKVYSCEETIMDPDGEFVTYHTSRVPIREIGSGKKLLCSVGVDITERVVNERKIRNFQRFFTNSDDCFITFEKVSSGFGFSYATENFQKTFGFESTQLQNTSLQSILGQIFSGDSKIHIQDLIENIINGEGVSFEFSFEKSGKTRHYMMKSIEANDFNKQQIMLSMFDITDFQNQRLRLQQNQEDLLKAARLASVGEMAAGIAHELKTPLNTIQAHIDLIQSLLSIDDPDQDDIVKSVGHIESTVNRIANIIVGLKSISKKAKGVDQTNVELSSLFDQVRGACDLNFQNKGITLNLNVKKGIQVLCDETQLSQVFVNLINNAVDAIENLKERWVSISTELSKATFRSVLRIVATASRIP